MYYSAIGILALLVLLIENQDIFLHRSDAFDKPAWRVYRSFLFAVMAYYLTDIAWGFLESFHMVRALFADTSIYYVAMAAGVLFWTQYVVVYLDERNAFVHFLLIAGRVLAAVVAVTAFINVFVPVLFTVDADCVYHALPARHAFLTAQIVLVALTSAYALTSIVRKRNAHGEEDLIQRYRTVALFGLIMTDLLIVQLWYPLLPLYTISYLLGTCLVRAFVIADEKEEYRRDLEEAERIAELRQTIVSLLDNMPCMSFSKDMDTGVYLACNQAFADFAHRGAPKDVVGLTDADIFDADTAAHFVRDDQVALTLDQPYIYFENVPDAEGNPRQFQTTKLPFTDEYGRVCLLGMSQDLSEIQRIEHEYAMTKEAYEQERSTGLIYSHIAQTLARSYQDLIYVNVDTGEFIEYRTDDEHGTVLSEERRGSRFFEACAESANSHVHPDDRDVFVEAMERQTLMEALERDGSFKISYRLLGERGSTYMNLNVSRMEDDERFIVIGVSDVDDQMKRQRAAELMAEEHTAYTRINALVGDFLCLYVVEPETGRYREYSASEGFDRYALPKEGPDFFAATRAMVRSLIHPADLARFLSLFTREGVLAEVADGGIFALTFRQTYGGQMIYVQLKAAMVQEKEGERLVVGLADIDSHVRQEEDYERRLAQAQREANVDALTGVKNRHAYLDAEEQLNRSIRERRAPEFAITILDVNDLKQVNDSLGHKAGDQYIRDACHVICHIFDHSPVFRVGGDEFAVISRGSDFERIEELLDKVADHNETAARRGGVIIACGMARYEGDASVAPVFERADLAMYENKSQLKARRDVESYL